MKFFIIGFLLILGGGLVQAAPMDNVKLAAPLPANLWIEMAKITQPGVVGIIVEYKAIQRRGRLQRDPLFDFLEEFLGDRFEPPTPGGEESSQPIGTGFIISDDGYVLTNNHVAEVADQHELKVSLMGPDGKPDEFIKAKLIGRDVRGDLALLKIDTKKKLTALQLGDSSKLQVGEYVAAFGNPFGHTNSMTQGIVSALGREIKEINRFPFIQTDASINPGNSGGPLVDTKGYVIGVNTAIDARAQGIGFAVPINYVKRVLETLKRGETVKRGFLGIGLQTLTPSGAAQLGLQGRRGVYVTEVRKGTPADKAGLEKGDVIVKYNDTKIRYSEDLMNSVQDTVIGQVAKLKILRQTSGGGFIEKNFDVKIGEFPDLDRWGRIRKQSTPKSRKESKFYQSSSAPFDLGFGMTDSSSGARKYYDIPVQSPFGPIVTRVQKGSKADLAGMQVGDVLLQINGELIYNIKSAMTLFKPRDNEVTVARQSKKLQLKL